MKLKYTIIPVGILLCFLLFFPQIALSYSKEGLLLWFHTLLPSLLPFMIISNFLIHTDLVKGWISRPRKLWMRLFGLTPNGAYALILGLFCGYPMGAKVTADLYRNGRIDHTEASYLLTFTNNTSPMFLSSYVLIETLARPDLTGISFFIIYISNFMCSFLFRFYYKRPFSIAKIDEEIHKNKKETSSIPPLGEIIDVSIMDAFASITRLGGYIILFSIFSGAIQNLLSHTSKIKYLLLGVTEITTGIHAIGSSSYPFSLQYALIMGMTAFGGLCITAQTKSMLGDTSLSLGPYIIAKLCNLALVILLSLVLI